MILFQAFERTLPQLQEMVELGGMKIKEVHATRFVKHSLFCENPFLTVSSILGDGPRLLKLFLRNTPLALY